MYRIIHFKVKSHIFSIVTLFWLQPLHLQVFKQYLPRYNFNAPKGKNYAQHSTSFSFYIYLSEVKSPQYFAIKSQVS